MVDVRITDCHSYLVGTPKKAWVFVQVDTDAGVTGTREASLGEKPETVAEHSKRCAAISSKRTRSVPRSSS